MCDICERLPHLVAAMESGEQALDVEVLTSLLVHHSHQIDAMLEVAYQDRDFVEVAEQLSEVMYVLGAAMQHNAKQIFLTATYERKRRTRSN